MCHSSFIVRRSSSILLLACVIAPLIGCRPPVPQGARFYNGPTEEMRAVVGDINQNHEKIPSLYALLNYRANIVDKQHNRTTTISGDGTLLFRRPGSLLLRGKKDLLGEVFAIGSNDQEFWLKLAGEIDTTWWGRYANLGKPCCQPIPIRPDLVLEVLGISLFDTNFLEQPAPVMRFNNDYDAYMFDWNVRGADRWMTQKEIWYDRKTKLPEMVLLFDPNGRVVLSAKLSEHVPLEIPDVAREQWPKIASRYDLFFPDDGSTISFSFSDDFASQRRGLPKPTSFRRPAEPGTKQVIQIDKDCGD